MRITKNDMARVIIAALYNMAELPAADHPKVIRRAKLRKDTLAHQHKLAIKAIQSART